MTADFNDADFLELVYAALFDQVRGAAFPGGLSFQTALRVVDTPDDVPPGAQPALYQVQGPLAASQKALGAAKWEVTVVEVIYVRADAARPGQQQMLPDTVANYLIWGVFQAMRPENDASLQTLGDLVYHAWIDGAVVPMVADEQIVIAVPIKILF